MNADVMTHILGYGLSCTFPAASDLKADIDSSHSSQLELNSWGVLYVHCGTFSKNPLITEASEVIFLGSGKVCVSICL